MAIFQDGGRRHFGFSKFGLFNGPNWVKSVSMRHGLTVSNFVTIGQTINAELRDISIFKNGSRRHLHFFKLKVLRVGRVKRFQVRCQAVQLD